MVTFPAGDIGKFIKNFNSNKAHGKGNVSIQMLKSCGDTINKPSELIFKQALITGTYHIDWKKSNIVPVHKKGDKQNIKIYRPVLLLLIRGKVFESILFYKMFILFLENNLITQKQSRFKPGDSCINQLLSITHETYQSFDDGFEVRSMFLDISKAFDKVWHRGIIFKLRQIDISGDLFNILPHSLSNKKQ